MTTSYVDESMELLEPTRDERGVPIMSPTSTGRFVRHADAAWLISYWKGEAQTARQDERCKLEAALLSKEDVAILTTLLEREWSSFTATNPAIRNHLDKLEALTKKVAALSNTEHPDTGGSE